MHLQPNLQNETIKIIPLKEEDFEKLYALASDPLVWAQHPNKNRYQCEVFQNFFKGAMESKGAFLVLNTETGEVMGSSRYYDFDKEKSSVAIGYTFLGRKFWGGKYNPSLKKLMMDYAFQFVENVIFHIGAVNIRSQTAIERLSAEKIAEEEITYYGEESKLNFVYRIRKDDWVK